MPAAGLVEISLVASRAYRVTMVTASFSPSNTSWPKRAVREPLAWHGVCLGYAAQTSLNSRKKFWPRIFSMRPDVHPRRDKSSASNLKRRGWLYSGISG